MTATADLPQFWKLCQCGNELQPILAPIDQHDPRCRYRLAVEAAPAPADTVAVSREWLVKVHDSIDPCRIHIHTQFKELRAEIDRLLEGARG